MPDTQVQEQVEEQRAWRAEMIALLEENNVDSELLPGCVDWGIEWYMECSRLCVAQFVDKKGTKEQLRLIVDESYLATVRKAQVPRYPVSNLPALRAIVLAKEVFILCNGPDAEWMRKIAEMPSPTLASQVN